MLTRNLDQISILLIESDLNSGSEVPEDILVEAFGEGITQTKNVAEALIQVRERRYDAVLYAFRATDLAVQENISLLAKTCNCALVAISTAGSDEMFTTVIEAGAYDYIGTKELSKSVLRRIVLTSIDRFALTKKVFECKAEIENRESLLRSVFELNSEAMLVLAQNHEIRSFNSSAAKLLEAEKGGLIGETFPFTIDPDAINEYEIPEADGGSKLVSLSSVDISWDGKPSKLIVLKDDSARKQVEHRLAQERAKLAVVLDSVSTGVIATNVTGEIETLNKEASRLLRVSQSEVKGRPLGKVLKLRHPDSGAIIQFPERELIRPEFIQAYGNQGLSLDSSGVHSPAVVTASMRPIEDIDDEGGVVGGIVVLTERASKPASNESPSSEASNSHPISVLVGGIAHDFNNLLAAILGNISIARVKIDSESELSKKLLSAEEAAMQARSLSQQLLAFSKGGAPFLEVTTIGELVKESALFVLRGSNVKCQFHADQELWPVEADKGQINQVINNLAINSDHAMPDGGVIDIKLQNVSVRENQITDLKAGHYVEITFSDNGKGIEAKHLKRIFDPYFTTKEDGNGLGLPSSQAVVRRHGGIITAESVVGKGSTFKIYLPKSESESAIGNEPTMNETNQDAPQLEEGSGRILVMDDMEAMMLVAGEILTVLGYEVEYASDGQEAIDAYKAAKESGNPFEAVVFDLTVPGGMGGEEASNILIEYDPDLIAIASSGYTTSNVMSEYEDSAFKAVVPKPYRINEMSEALKRVLKR